jgi:hypothetical protein
MKHPKGEGGRFVTKTVDGKKQCRVCKEWKDVETEFRWRIAHNGKAYPQSECNPCHSLQVTGAYVPTNPRKSLEERQELRREYERIYKEAQRRKNGIPIRNLKSKQAKPLQRHTYIDATPFFEFWDWAKQELDVSETEFCASIGIDDTLLPRARRTGEISTRLIDQILTHAGHHHMIHILEIE